MADIDRKDLGSAAGKQHVGEAPGRRTDIDRNLAGHVPAEMRQRMIELEPAARHPWMVATFDAERRIGRELLARLVDLAVTGIDEPREDQRLCTRAAFGKPAIGEQLVGADFAHVSPRKRGCI